MNAKLHDCNMTLSDATKFIGRMNKFVDRTKLFNQIHETIQLIELYFRTYATLPKRDRCNR